MQHAGHADLDVRDETWDRSITVLVVDDHPAICEALSDTVSGQDDMAWIGAASTAAEAIALLDRGPLPDVIVIDIALSDAYGLDLVRKVRAEYPEVRMVVFSVYDEGLYAERAIRAGALAYLMKSEPTQNVVDAIRSVNRGDVYLSRQMASQILGKVVRGQRSQLVGSIDQLTSREFVVFRMLGEGRSVQDITDHLGLSRKTVETYRRRAKEKLGFDTIPELLQYAVQWKCGQEQDGHVL